MERNIRSEVINEPLRLVLAQDELAYILEGLKLSVRMMAVAALLMIASASAIAFGVYADKGVAYDRGFFRDRNGTAIVDKTGMPVNQYSEARTVVYGPVVALIAPVAGMVGAVTAVMWIISISVRIGKLVLFMRDLRKFMRRHKRDFA